MGEDAIPYGMHWVDDDDIESVVRVLRSDRLTQGQEVARFEERLAEVCGARHAVAFSNGTAALHGAMAAAGIGPGDEVITTPLTFVATANSVVYQGGVPVFADIDPVTGNLDPQRAEAAVTPRTRAIAPVHYAGLPVDLDAFSGICRRHDLRLIEDAAHALGAVYRDEPIGCCRRSDMATFSFHPVKHVTTGEGGMVTTNDDELRQRLELFRKHGITSDPNRLTRTEGPWYYEMQVLGRNNRLSDIQSALGLSQMDKLGRFMARRREIAARYLEAFSGEEALRLPGATTGAVHAYHLFTVRLELERLSAGRRQIFEELHTEGIMVQVHYIPVHFQPFYRERFGFSPGDFPLAEDFYNREITLPLFPRMTDAQVERVITTVGAVLDRHRK